MEALDLYVLLYNLIYIQGGDRNLSIEFRLNVVHYTTYSILFNHVRSGGAVAGIDHLRKNMDEYTIIVRSRMI